MTIFNEAARLFFAVTALVLVGLLSAPMGGMEVQIPEKAPAKVAVSKELKVVPAKGKKPLKITDRKVSRKIVLKKG